MFDNSSVYLCSILRFDLTWGHISIMIKHHILKNHILELPKLVGSSANVISTICDMCYVNM